MVFLEIIINILLNHFEELEVKEFIQHYHRFLHPLIKGKSIVRNTADIFKILKGHPIMVRFAALNNGLVTHVEQMYFEYFQDTRNNYRPLKQRLKIVFLIALFDIPGIILVDDILDRLGLLDTAKEINGTVIRRDKKGLENHSSQMDYAII